MVEKKKPAALCKSLLIRVSVNREQHDLLAAAAERSALTISSWLRTVGVVDARRYSRPERNDAEVKP